MMGCHQETLRRLQEPRSGQAAANTRLQLAGRRTCQLNRGSLMAMVVAATCHPGS